MQGLIIKAEPLEKILSGEKTWEMRSRASHRTGTIALIQSKSGQVVGTAEMVRCVGPLSREDLQRAQKKHQASATTLADNFGYADGHVYAWELKNARRLLRPIKYDHPSGAVIWVNLESITENILSSAKG